jgi:hypothetical protein
MKSGSIWDDTLFAVITNSLMFFGSINYIGKWNLAGNPLKFIPSLIIEFFLLYTIPNDELGRCYFLLTAL